MILSWALCVKGNTATNCNNLLVEVRMKVYTVKILKFWTPKKFAVITLKFEQGGSTIEWYVQKVQMEWKTV